MHRLILLFSLICPPAWAENWFFVERCETPDCPAASVLGGANSIYIDAESINFTDGELTFWSRYRLDKAGQYGQALLTKQEIDLLNNKARSLESIWLDSDSQVLAHVAQISDWRPYAQNSSLTHQIEATSPYLGKNF